MKESTNPQKGINKIMICSEHGKDIPYFVKDGCPLCEMEKASFEEKPVKETKAEKKVKEMYSRKFYVDEVCIDDSPAYYAERNRIDLMQLVSMNHDIFIDPQTGQISLDGFSRVTPGTKLKLPDPQFRMPYSMQSAVEFKINLSRSGK